MTGEKKNFFPWRSQRQSHNCEPGLILKQQHADASVVLIQTAWASAYWMHYHTYMTAATNLHASTLGRVTVATNTANQQSNKSRLCRLHRRHTGSSTMSTEQSGACVKYTITAAWTKAATAKLWCACIRDFTWIAVFLVVQVDFSKWKAVCCGQITLHWTLESPTKFFKVSRSHTITCEFKILVN